MDDEKLLRTLGTLAAHEERDIGPSKWERLLRGELSADEVAELERLAETDEETALLLSAHRPLDATARERIAADLADHVAPGARAPESVPAQQQRQHQQQGDVLARRRWRSRAYALTASLALAAGIALFVTRGPDPEPLPLYALDANGAASSRGPAKAGAPSRPCGLRAGRRDERGSFELIARTDGGEGAGAGAITARAYLVQDGFTRPWTGALEISPSGSVRIQDSTQRLAGATELLIAIGRKELLDPSAAFAKARRGASSGRGWQVLSCAVFSSDD